MPKILGGSLLWISKPVVTSVFFNDVINPWLLFCFLIGLLLLEEFEFIPDGKQDFKKPCVKRDDL